MESLTPIKIYFSSSLSAVEYITSQFIGGKLQGGEILVRS